MANWLIIAQDEDYDIARAFDELPEIYWNMRNRKSYQVNDIIYLYVSEPIGKIMYKCQILELAYNVQLPEIDKKYWKDKDKFQSCNADYIIIKGLSKVDKPTLSVQYLREQGYISETDTLRGPKTDRISKGKPEKRIKEQEKLFKFITEQFDTEIENFDYPDEANVKSDLFPEGAKQTVQVNRYERNPAARAKCIEIYGTRCEICKMSFEETYGTFAKDFIHVHHKTPLRQIAESYEVNPETDLIPVCPNCHAMLHRHENGEPIEVERLKQLYEDQKKLSGSQT